MIAFFVETRFKHTACLNENDWSKKKSQTLKLNYSLCWILITEEL